MYFLHKTRNAHLYSCNRSQRPDHSLMALNQGVSIQNELFLAFVSKPAENWLMHQTNKPTWVGVNPDRVKIAFGTSGDFPTFP